MTDDPNLRSTPILDYAHPEVDRLVDRLRAAGAAEPRLRLQAAHRHLAGVMRAVYSIEETIPVSELLRRNEGSCSQRMGCLEALARGLGIRTRVRALWLDRRFWFDRLPLLRPFLPQKTLMPWPQFDLGAGWVDFDEIHGSIGELAARAAHPFTNRGESLFDAVEHVPVDFLDKATRCGHPEFSLRSLVVADGGFYDTRDDLLRALDHPSWLGKALFDATYGGRPVRRLPD